VSDGARDELAGYLYQLVAVTGLTAKARNCIGEKDIHAGELTLLAKEAKILHEAHGQAEFPKESGQWVNGYRGCS